MDSTHKRLGTELLTRLIIPLGLLVLAVPSTATPMHYSFNYSFADGRILTGELWGELQSDFNTVQVSSLETRYSLLGMSTAFSLSDAGPEQIATLNGVGTSLYGFGQVPVYESIAKIGISDDLGYVGVSISDLGEPFYSVFNVPFDRGRWQLTPTISSPATLMLFALGFPGLWFGCRGGVKTGIVSQSHLRRGAHTSPS